MFHISVRKFMSSLKVYSLCGGGSRQGSALTFEREILLVFTALSAAGLREIDVDFAV